MMTQRDDVEAVKKVADKLENPSVPKEQCQCRDYDQGPYPGCPIHGKKATEQPIVYGPKGSGCWADPECLGCQRRECLGHYVVGNSVRQLEAMAKGLLTVSAAYTIEGGAVVYNPSWRRDEPENSVLYQHIPCDGDRNGLMTHDGKIEDCQYCNGATDKGYLESKLEYNAVEPPHYSRGPEIKGDIGSQITQGKSGWTHVVKCIEVMRHIKDPRLATAFKYLWRVAFGGKREPGETRTQREIDERDISSAIWYLQDWVDNPT